MHWLIYYWLLELAHYTLIFADKCQKVEAFYGSNKGSTSKSRSNRTDLLIKKILKTGTKW